MKINKILFIISLIFIFVSGCTTKHDSNKWDNHAYSPIEISVTSQLNADIEVDTSKKITGTARGSYWLGLIKFSGDSHYQEGYGGSGPTGKVKEAAVYNALSPFDGDILISPSYTVKKTVHPYLYLGWVTITVEVTGYEGKIKNIK